MSGECRNPRCRKPLSDAFLCQDCGVHLTEALDSAPWMVEQLGVTATRQDRVSRGLRSGSRPDQPLPVNLRAADAGAALANAITTWARHIAESRGLTGPSGGPGEAAAWLIVHQQAVRLDEAAGALYVDITRRVDGALTLINPQPADVFRGPCPTVVQRGPYAVATDCGTPLYGGDADAEHVHTSGGEPEDAPIWVSCPACGVRHEVARLQTQLLARLGATAMPEAQIVKVLRELGEPVPRSTVASWIARERLKPCGYVDGVPVYLLMDARRLRAAGVGGSAA